MTTKHLLLTAHHNTYYHQKIIKRNARIMADYKLVLQCERLENRNGLRLVSKRRLIDDTARNLQSVLESMGTPCSKGFAKSLLDLPSGMAIFKKLELL